MGWFPFDHQVCFPKDFSDHLQASTPVPVAGILKAKGADPRGMDEVFGTFPPPKKVVYLQIMVIVLWSILTWLRNECWSFFFWNGSIL